MKQLDELTSFELFDYLKELDQIKWDTGLITAIKFIPLSAFLILVLAYKAMTEGLKMGIDTLLATLIALVFYSICWWIDGRLKRCKLLREIKSRGL